MVEEDAADTHDDDAVARWQHVERVRDEHASCARHQRPSERVLKQVRANVQARDVVVHGKVEGNVRGTERVELKKSAILMGDIFTQRIVIEEGAFFKGGIDIQKDAAGAAKSDIKVPATTAATPYSAPAAHGASVSVAPASGGNAIGEPKKF